MKKKSNNNKKYFYLVVALIFVFILLLNILTPLLADDFSYSFGLNGKLKSIKDVIDYQVNHWNTWGGRSVVHTIAQIFLLSPKYVFNIFNPIVYVLFTLLVYKHVIGKEKKYDVSLYVIINALIWFSLPAFGQNMLWLIGSCNYLWGTTLVLLFLLPFRLNIDEDKKDNIFMIIGMLLLGVLAGWTNENTAAAMLSIVVLSMIYRKYNKLKINKWNISGFIGALFGFGMMILAPGNSVRSAELASDRSFIAEMHHRLVEYSNHFVEYMLPLVILLVIIAIIGYYKGENKKNNLLKVLIYGVGSFLAVYSMIMSPTFPERSWMGPIIYLIIAIGMSINYLDRKEEFIKTTIKFSSIVLVLAFAINYYSAVINTKNVYSDWNKRIDYINSEKEKGNLDIELERIYTYNSHSPQYLLVDLEDDPTIWPNTALARYFGVKSIRPKEKSK